MTTSGLPPFGGLPVGGMAGLEEPERLELALLLCMLSARFPKYKNPYCQHSRSPIPRIPLKNE